MAVSRRRRSDVYGLGQPLITTAPYPIVSSRSPTEADMAIVGTLWADKETSSGWILVNIISNRAQWIPLTLNTGLDISARTFFAQGDQGTGKAGETALTNAVDIGVSTGIMWVRSKTNKSAENAGFFKMYIGTTPVWVPYFDDIYPA